jgi:hypothetical protein
MSITSLGTKTTKGTQYFQVLSNIKKADRDTPTGEENENNCAKNHIVSDLGNDSEMFKGHTFSHLYISISYSTLFRMKAKDKTILISFHTPTSSRIKTRIWLRSYLIAPHKSFDVFLSVNVIRMLFVLRMIYNRSYYIFFIKINNVSKHQLPSLHR